MAVTELRFDEPGYGFSTPIAPEEAYLVGMQFRAMQHHELWFDGRSVTSGAFGAGTSCFYDLATNPIAYCADPFHSVHFYMPVQALSEAAEELAMPGVSGLRYPLGEFIADPVIHYLALCLMPALHAANKVNQTFVDHVLLALRTYLVTNYGGVRQARSVPQYGLAPWQERRVKELMAEHLSDGVSLAELASACGLSLSAFARGFKRNTGVTPHQWLMNQRLELATRLMADARLSLVDVALASGFADQCHFTRVFTAKMGVSPGAWRVGRGR
jgi:AraC-like DNA-binding protein